MLPRCREDELIVRQLSDETLVYDLKRDKAHCLNHIAASIWRHCDGSTSVAELAVMLRQQFQMPADDAVVWLALRQLQTARLLEESIELPADHRRCSRRTLIRRLGAAAAVPIVMTILAPTARAQASALCAGQFGNASFCAMFDVECTNRGLMGCMDVGGNTCDCR